MLFKALIERLLGSDEAQDWKEQYRGKTSRFSYTNYPSLVRILTDLLDPNGPLKESMKLAEGNSPMDLHGAEGVFPALQILRQAPPPEKHRPAITTSVIHLLGSPHWHLREMAARTVVSLKFSHEYFDTITTLLSLRAGSQNSQHGVLLCLKYLLRKFLNKHESQDSKALESILNGLIGYYKTNYRENSCPFTRGAFVDLVNICGLSLLSRQTRSAQVLESWSKLATPLSIQYRVMHGADSALFRVSAIENLLVNHILLYAGVDKVLVTERHKVSFRSWINRVATDDPDTCCAFLDKFPSVVQEASKSSLARCIPDLLGLLFSMFLDITDSEVKDKSQSLLSDFFVRDRRLPQQVFKDVPVDNIFRGLDILEQQCEKGSPGNLQSSLHLYGFVLDFAFITFEEKRSLVLKRLARYARLLRMIIVDINVCSRLSISMFVNADFSPSHLASA
jgi:hypothetical protein